MRYIVRASGDEALSDADDTVAARDLIPMLALCAIPWTGGGDFLSRLEPFETLHGH